MFDSERIDRLALFGRARRGIALAWQEPARIEGLGVGRFHDPTTEFLCSVNEHMDDNVAMLGAILQRLIMDRVEAGMPLKHAIRDVARHHSEIVRTGASAFPG